MPEEKSIWQKIAEGIAAGYNWTIGNRRRIAIISSALTTIGGLTGSVTLIIIGTAGTALFGGLDAKENPQEYLKLVRMGKK